MPLSVLLCSKDSSENWEILGVASSLWHLFFLVRLEPSQTSEKCVFCRKTSFRPALQDCKFSSHPFMPSLLSLSAYTFIHNFWHLFVFRYVSFIKWKHISVLFFSAFLSLPPSTSTSNIYRSMERCCLLWVGDAPWDWRASESQCREGL